MLTDRSANRLGDPVLQLLQTLASNGLGYSVACEVVLGTNAPRQFRVGVRGAWSRLRSTLFASGRWQWFQECPVR